MIPLREKIRNPKCRLCPLWENAQSVCLIGDGIYPADLLLLGEAPGFREDDINRPFSGRAGELLDSVLETLDIRRGHIFISNAVKCRPVDKTDHYRNAKPSKAQIRTCSQEYLTREVRWVKPKLIVAMGAVAAEGILQQTCYVNKYRNKIWRTKEPFVKDIPVIVTYHPAAVLRQDNLLKYLVEDFEWALKLLKGEDEQEKLSYNLVERISEIDGIFEAKKVSVDLETDGLDPFLKGRSIISIQLSTTPGTGYYLRWNKEVRGEAKELLEKRDSIKVGHNVNKFDRNWLRKEGIELRGHVRDTLVEVHLVDENFRPKDLDTVTSNWTSLKGHKQDLIKYIKQNKCDFRDVPLDIMIPYGCGDVDGALRIEKKFTKHLKSLNQWPLYRMQERAGRLFADVEWNGFKIDVPLIDEMARLYEKRLDKVENKLGGINPRSFKQVGEKLYDEWKLPGSPDRWGKRTVKDTTEDTLLSLLELDLEERQTKFIKRILKARETGTLLSRYILGLSDFIREGDLVHPNFKLHGTVTGRLSCADPNLQNIPREGDIKRLFISRFGKRGRILQVDVSQAELRFAAHLSQEPTLIEYFKRGDIDIHTAVASRIYKIPIHLVTPQQRKKTKIVNFGILYGGGPGKMAREMGTSIGSAARFIDQWLDEFPAWREYGRRVKREVLRDGFVRSPFGRIRHLPIIDPDTESGKEAQRQAINSPIQGGVSDYTVHCGIEAWKRLRKSKITCLFVAEVHDSWIVDTLEEHVEEVSTIFREEFENADLTEYDGLVLSVPMKVEVQVGPNWKELTDVEV